MSQSGQLIQPPNTLRAKVGGGFGINPDAIAKAEAALQAMAGQFETWLNDEIVKLDVAQAAVSAHGPTSETLDTLYLRAHDLKGLGSTYQYPLVTRLAGSLCKLIDTPEKRTTASRVLIDGHVDAIKAVVRDKIQTDDHPVGKALAETLEARVDQHLG